MTSTRDAFLQRVRQAVQAGNQAGVLRALPERGPIAYQGGGNDPVAGFQQMCQAAGGKVYVAADQDAARQQIVELAAARQARQIVLDGAELLTTLGLEDALAAPGRTILRAADADKQSLFAADLGITGVDWLIAETGSIVLRSRPTSPRSVSLLPPVHVAVASWRQILPDLFDLFGTGGVGPTELPSGMVLITGPSKTGDIELRLVTGVHGPGEVHVVITLAD